MEITNIKLRGNTPYPQIANATNDAKTVQILKDLLASKDGEMVAIMQYFYQASISQQSNQDIADILQEISIVEMEHMELLMNAIIAFGGNPKYSNAQGQPFNSNYVNYSATLKGILDANIKNEECAIKNYYRAQEIVSNGSLKELFARIIEDEQLHLQAFKILRNTVGFLSL